MTIISENQAIWVKRQRFHALFLGSGCIMLWFSHFRDHNSFTSFVRAQCLLLRKTLNKCQMLLISHYFCNEHVSDSCWLQMALSKFVFTGCSEGRDSQPAARYHCQLAELRCSPRAVQRYPGRRGGSETFKFLCRLNPNNTGRDRKIPQVQQ